MNEFWQDLNQPVPLLWSVVASVLGMAIGSAIWNQYRWWRMGRIVLKLKGKIPETPDQGFIECPPMDAEDLLLFKRRWNELVDRDGYHTKWPTP